jgi:hypothetical protein
MAQYIDKVTVVAEIDRLQEATMDKNQNFLSSYHEGIFDGLSMLENFLDTLEVKEIGVDLGDPQGDIGVKWVQEEPVSQDLEEAAWQYYDRNKPPMPPELDFHKELVDFFKAGVRWKEQNNSNLSEVLVRDNLDKMAEEYSSCTYLEEVLGEGDREVLKARLKNTFKAGAQWQKQQDQKAMEIMDEVYFKSCDMIRKQMIDKTCEFLKSYRRETRDGMGYVAGIIDDDTIEDFKKLMKD